MTNAELTNTYHYRCTKGCREMGYMVSINKKVIPIVFNRWGNIEHDAKTQTTWSLECSNCGHAYTTDELKEISNSQLAQTKFFANRKTGDE